jgi:hypothetical protein
VQSLPEMFYGRNRLYVLNPIKGILLSFDPFDCLEKCVDRVKKIELDSPREGSSLTFIDLNPSKEQVADSEVWAAKDLSSVEDYEQIETRMDWNFSSPYKGSIHRLN